jgi:hypothetical protein
MTAVPHADRGGIRRAIVAAAAVLSTTFLWLASDASADARTNGAKAGTGTCAKTQPLTEAPTGEQPQAEQSGSGLQTQAAPGAAPFGDLQIKPFSEVTSTALCHGDFVHIYDPSVGEDEPWYVNDHTFVQAEDGTWHLFGITHAEPMINPGDEEQFGHATAPSLHGPWTKQPDALTVDRSRGETRLWAPHVIEDDGVYYMFYNGGGSASESQINLATSTDLYNWKRHGDGALFTDGVAARDPFVTRVGDDWVMYYTATRTRTGTGPGGDDMVVAYRTSDDLVNWGQRHIAFDSAKVGGMTESPYVVQRPDGTSYLFIGPRRQGSGAYLYSGTNVFASDDPLHFDSDDLVGQVAAHAPEIVQDENGDWYTSHAGWANQGVWLAPLHWDKPARQSGVRVKTPDYRAKLVTAPYPELTSLRFKVDGEFREVLSRPFRGTLAYMAPERFGMRQVLGAAKAVEVSGDRIVLRDMPMGYQPITVDWTLDLGRQTLDTSFDWHVDAPMTAPVLETGWNLEVDYPRIGHPGDLDDTGDLRGFPEWVLASDDASSLAVAYREGSAWGEDNTWFRAVNNFGDEHSDVAWQSVWNSRGEYIPPGDYEGGTWRIGASDAPDDTAFADELYRQVNR